MKLILLFLAISFVTTATAQISPERAHFNLSKEKLALSGYDPISYFNGKPAEGKSSIAYEYQGVKYFFSKEENKEKFVKDPARYEPQYGGWCAYAMGNSGEKVTVDPETYKLVNGKLYLFYNSFFNNTLTSWNKNEAILKSQADKNWSKLLQEK